MSTHPNNSVANEALKHSNPVVSQGKQHHIPVVDFYRLATNTDPRRDTNRRATTQQQPRVQPCKHPHHTGAAQVSFSASPLPPPKPPRRSVHPHLRHASKLGEYSQVPGQYTESDRVVEIIAEGAMISQRIGTFHGPSGTPKVTSIPSGRKVRPTSSKNWSSRATPNSPTKLPKQAKAKFTKATGKKARAAAKHTAQVTPNTSTGPPPQKAIVSTKNSVSTPAVATSAHPEHLPKNEPKPSHVKGSREACLIPTEKQAQTRGTPITESKRKHNNAKPSDVPKPSSQPPSRQATHDKPQPKSRFGCKEYLSSKQVQRGLKQGTLYRGVVRINKNNTTEAYATCEGLTQDVFLYGRHARNRAFHGDKVIVALLDTATVMAEKKSRRHRRRSGRVVKSDAGPTSEQTLVDSNNHQVAPENKPNDDDDKVETGTSNSTSSTINQTTASEKLCGEVVHVLSDGKPRYICGVLRSTGKQNIAQKKDASGQLTVPPPIKCVQLVPDDLRMPLVTIHNADRFPNLAEDIQRDTLFQVRITKWTINGYHPVGVIEKRLGQRGVLDVEVEGLLVDNNVSHTPFSHSVEQCLPQLPWSIPAEELARRRDLRGQCIFTIDPATAKDLDDAVSCRALPNGNFEVGVHIADVSHFVRPNTALDKEAQARATTVYLVQTAIPMLPRVLCEELCSLNPGVDRLTFSVMWEMTPEARVVNVWFGRTMINSCCQLAYEQAQTVVEGQSLPSTSLIMRHSRSTVEETIRSLFKISIQLRDRRFAGGALSINSIKLHFDLDSGGQPIGCKHYDIKDSNRLIEEFMLLANMSVAEKLMNGLPDLSLLRCHPKPITRSLKRFHELVQALGYHMDISSAGALHRSLTAVENPVHRMLLQYLAVRPMCRALYFCTDQQAADQFSHYALNVPLYTHFTSPIRRYADVMVHRMLDHLLSTPEQPLPWNSTTIHNIALHCNDRKYGARMAQDKSSKVYLIQHIQRLIREQNGEPIRCQAHVVQVGQASAEVLVWEYGLEEQIFWEKQADTKHAHQKGHHRCFIDWSLASLGNSKSTANGSGSNAKGENDADSACQDLVDSIQNLNLSGMDQPVRGQELSDEPSDKCSRSETTSGINKTLADPSAQEFIRSRRLNPKFTQEISLFSTVPVTIGVRTVRGMPSLYVDLDNPFR
ncbi:hypothetical protein IWQ61_005119 [Dispira simplex]|nr:hypothetical protein IWQ61_005119 [Dispira simplex]